MIQLTFSFNLFTRQEIIIQKDGRKNFNPRKRNCMMKIDISLWLMKVRAKTDKIFWIVVRFIAFSTRLRSRFSLTTNLRLTTTTTTAEKNFRIVREWYEKHVENLRLFALTNVWFGLWIIFPSMRSKNWIIKRRILSFRSNILKCNWILKSIKFE